MIGYDVLTVPSIGYLPLANHIGESENHHIGESENHHTLHNNAASTPLYSVEEQYRPLPSGWEASTRGASAPRNSGKLLAISFRLFIS